MRTEECWLLHLPLEILDNILSYVSDIDLICIHKVCEHLQESANRLIYRRRKLNFCGCYALRDDSLLSLTNSGIIRENLSHLNLNHCYWIHDTTLLVLVNQLYSLQELHLIECKVTTNLIESILEKDFSSLSISWSDEWDKTLRFVYRRDQRIKSAPCPPILNYLKHLIIFIPRCVGQHFFLDISQFILEHCAELQTLKLYDSPSGFFKPRDHRREQRLQPRFFLNRFDLILPKLQNFIIDLYDEPQQNYCLNRIRRSSFALLEHENIWASVIVPWISTDSTDIVCLDDHPKFKWFNSQRMFPVVGPLIWAHRATLNCKNVSLSNTCLHNSYKLFEIIANKCPKLERLNLSGCQIAIDHLLLGMSALAAYCKKLAELSLTVDPGEIHLEGPIRCLFNVLGEFRLLKVLHITTHFLSCSKNYIGHELDSSISSLTLTSDDDFNVKMIENNPFYQLTQCCKELEELKIISNKMENERVISEVVLASISNWKNLKTLHLINIPTLGQAQFLPLIVKSCTKLQNLYLKDVCCSDQCIYMPSLTEILSEAKSLKDLSIVQKIVLSVELCENLKKCTTLERLFVQIISVPNEMENQFIDAVTQLPNLVVTAIQLEERHEQMTKQLKKEFDCIKASKPPGFYIVDNIIFSEDFVWPVIHHDLQQYKKNIVSVAC
ncbi:hypothetical protein CHUAL_007537 [Chamberlinius hualienensis]